MCTWESLRTALQACLLRPRKNNLDQAQILASPAGVSESEGRCPWASSVGVKLLLR